MIRKLLFTSLISLVLFITGCNSQAKPADDEQIIFVNSQWVDCVGAGPMQCLQIKTDPAGSWQFFYSQIDGFYYVPGYQYQLLIKVEHLDNPPADGSSQQWRLIQVIDRVPDPTMSVGSRQWQQYVNTIVQAQDPQGHGPDLGSDEWCNAIEFKLFKRLSGLTPCSAPWNSKVDDAIKK